MTDAGELQQLKTKPYRFYFRKHRRTFALGVLSLFLTNLLDCCYPLAVKLLIDQVESGLYGKALLSGVLTFLALMAGVAFFRFAWRMQFGKLQHQVGEELRLRVFSKFTTLGGSFYQKNPVGQLMSLISNDVNSFRMAVGGGVLVSLDALFLILIILPMMLYLSVEWTWKTLIFLPLLPFLIQKIEKLIHERYKEQQQEFAFVSGAAQEIISGIRVIKSYAQEPAQTAHFNQASRRFEEACNRSARIDSLFLPVMETAVASGTAILLWVGAPEIMSGTLTLGSFYAFSRYIHKMTWPMTAIGIGVTMIQQGKASIERIVELLATPTDIPDTGEQVLTHFAKLEVRNLSFTYPGADHPALENLSFTINRGETFGIIGSVGSGKSTLMQLICRLYPVPRGMIFVNDWDINDIKQSSLWSTFAMVPQDAFLFSESVGENMALGLEQTPSAEALEHFAQIVNIDEEIGQLAQGYATPLGERGVNLSGGQKQRLTIARALIRKSPVMILDDSLSAVDAQTEKNIMLQISSALHTRSDSPEQTTILVSHRLAPLARAHRILVLHNGQIEALGSADELSQISPTYQKLAELQQERGATESSTP